MTKRKWLRVFLIGAVLMVAASFGFSRALRSQAARRYLIAHLTASFGRNVDVSWFEFSLLDGARIEAHLVSVSEDPHFGSEYFLRADTLTAGLRWRALLAGRFEFGAVSLSRPSLNLTRDTEGHWNVERWLPPVLPSGARPGFVGPIAPAGAVRAARPARIDVNAGRINFKQEDNKSPFALVDVAGRVEQNDAGRWQLDLEARPMRDGVALPEIGTLRLRGSIAGTSSRLQPADLNLTWRNGSVADTLRLIRQDDYGMRGQLAVDLNARVAPLEPSSLRAADSGGAQWGISGVARFTGMHGWRLPERDTDPAANLSVEVNWRLGQRHAEVRKLLVEMPASRLQGIGELDWARGLRPQLHIESSTLSFGDVLSWYRALRPDVGEDLRADGALDVDLELDGWPMQFQRGEFASPGGVLTAKSLDAPLRIGALKASVSRGGLDVAPTVLSIGSPASKTVSDATSAAGDGQNSFVLRGSLFPRANGVFRWPPDWNFSIEGATPRVQDWLAFSGAMGYAVHSVWTAEGELAVKMRGVHLAVSPDVPWLGTMDFVGLQLSPAYVNQPVLISKAHVEFAPLQRIVTLSAAEAFGATWHGSLNRKSSDSEWMFDLSADHLDATDLDRWLGPRARPGFLARFAGLNSAAASNPPAGAVVTRLAARGRLRAAVIDVPPLRLEQFDGETELTGRTMRIRKGKADFYGGRVSGSFDAQLLPDPSYEFQGRLDRVDLAQLGHAVPFLDGKISGNASSSLLLSAHGIGRRDLVRSMQAEGSLTGRNIEMRSLNLSRVFPGALAETESAAFSSVQGEYRVQAGAIDLANLVMDNSLGSLEAEGRIDFSHALNIRFHPTIFQAATAPASASPPSFLLGGTIESPKLVIPSSVSKPPARPSSR